MALNVGDTIKGFLSGMNADGDRRDMSDNGQVIGDLDQRFKEAAEDRRKYERDWQINSAFLKGNQWLEFDRLRQTLYLPPAPPWRVRLVVNMIQPVFRTVFGKITVQKSQAKVDAANDSTEASENAKAQNELLEFLWDKCDAERENGEALKWLLITGTGIEKVCWDKSAGDTLGPDDQGQTPTDDSGNPVKMGQVAQYAVSPFEFYPEPLATKVEDMEWCFHTKVRPASYVERKYGVKIEADSIPSDSYLSGQASDPSDVYGTGTTTKGVVVKEYWERPNTQNPEGRYVVYAGTQVLVQGPNPYEKLPIPFIIAADTAVPGRLWGRTFLSDLVPLQRNYNKARSQAIEIRNSIAKPKYAVAKNALDAGVTISSAPSEIIVYNPVPGAYQQGLPSIISGAPVPQSFFADLDKTQAEFYEIAGLHDFSRGILGIGVRAAWALQMIIEQDDTRIGILKRAWDKAIMDTESAKLKLVKQYYAEPRSVTVTGSDNAVEVHEFYADQIPDDVQVRMITSGALPSSRAAKQQFVLELWAQKLVTDPKVAFKMLEMGDTEGVTDDYDMDVRQAQRENEVLKTGNEVQIHDFDNHDAHVHEHDAYRKGEEYEKVSVDQPAVADVFAAHVQQHKDYVIQQVQATMPQPGAPAPLPARAGGPAVSQPLPPSSMPKKFDISQQPIL